MNASAEKGPLSGVKRTSTGRQPQGRCRQPRHGPTPPDGAVAFANGIKQPDH